MLPVKETSELADSASSVPQSKDYQLKTDKTICHFYGTGFPIA